MAQKIHQIPTINDGYVQIPEYKVIILGPMASGKTALSFRFCEDKYEETVATMQIDYREKVLKINNRHVLMKLWDTVGQERFAQSLTPNFYRGVEGVVYVFDTTSQKSFEDVNFWITECRKFVDADIPMILVGTKCDMPAQVSENEARIFADRLGLPYFTTSAKKDEEATHIKAIFTTLALKIKEKRPLMRPEAIRLDKTMLVDPPKSFREKYCC